MMSYTAAGGVSDRHGRLDASTVPLERPRAPVYSTVGTERTTDDYGRLREIFWYDNASYFHVNPSSMIPAWLCCHKPCRKSLKDTPEIFT